MKIEVTKIKFHPGHDDSHSYTAVILINGVKAFTAFNDGWGGEDAYTPVSGYTGPSQEEIDKWLAANTPAHEVEGMKLDNCLEFIVGDALNANIRETEVKKIMRKWERLLAKEILVIRDGKLSGWPKLAPTTENISRVVERHGDSIQIINFGNDELKKRALHIWCPDLQSL